MSKGVNEDISIDTLLVTLITSKGNLVINFAVKMIKNKYVINENIVTYGTFKSGLYSKYSNVKVSINAINNDYRIVTISY